MSNASVTSTKREVMVAELVQELESVRALNNSLRVYLEHVRILKKNLLVASENCEQLNKVNKQWIETIHMMK